MKTKEEKAAYLKLWRQNNPDKSKAIYKRYQEKNKEKISRKSREQRLKFRGTDKVVRAARKCVLNRRFNLSLAAYDEKLIFQRGVCAICDQPETRTLKSGKISFLAVDHNHITGKIRGLLCSRCNTSLGMLKECRKIIANMLNYLDFYEPENIFTETP